MSERDDALRTARIIHVAITLGPATFLGIVFFLLNREDTPFGRNETGTLISLVSAGVAAMAIVLVPIAARSVRAQAKDPLQAFRGVAVVRAAILEMPALLGCVAYMLEGKRTPVGAIVAAVMILILAGTVPTGPRLDAWLTGSGASRDE